MSPTERGPETLASQAYSRLKREIVAGQIAPGAKLRIRDLCERHDIGLSPIREALNRLSSEGLVRHTDQTGFVSAPLSEKDFNDLMKTRCALTEAALRISMLRAEKAWTKRLIVSFDRLSHAPHLLSDGVVNPAWEAAHGAYHTELVAGCGSLWMMRFCGQLQDAWDRYCNHFSRAGLARTDHLPEHRAVLDAVLGHEAEKACRLLRQHLERTATLIRHQMELALGLSGNP